MTRKLVQVLDSLTRSEFDAQETMRQLTYGQNLVRFWSWGVSQRIAFKEKGLLLKVNARRHKSYVFIVLDFNDTYTVHLISSQGRVIKTFSEIYFDNLCEVIDDEIERVEQYQD